MLSSIKEYRPFGVFKKAPATQFYLLQLIAFVYMAYRFASRDYSIYGLLPDEAFDYPFNFRNEIYPFPLGYFTTFQFIYSVLPHPSTGVIFGLQIVVIGSALLGAVGIKPKLNAWICFLLATHITGIFQSVDSPIDGGTLILCALGILAISPKEAFYTLNNRYKPVEKRSVAYHWPITLLFIVTTTFYVFAGIAKVVDVGPHFPFALQLQNLAIEDMHKSILTSSRYCSPAVAEAHLSPVMSVVGGAMTMIGEIGFFTILFWPRYRFFFVVSMVGLHTLVYFTAGINFLGSSFILLLCMDYNVFVRSFKVNVGSDHPKLDWFEKYFGSSSSVTLEQTSNSSQFVVNDENGEVYEGIEAFEMLAHRNWMLWPVALIFKLPGAIYLLRPLFKGFESKR